MLAAGDSTEARGKLSDVFNEIRQGLKGDFSLINYTFGEETTAGNAPLFNEKKSDYSNLVNSVYGNHFNENIGAMILVGDGIYNMGSNPVSGIEKLNFPVYTIGVGDTNIVKDAGITGIRVNRNAFVGNQFPVEVNLRYEKMHGESSMIRVLSGGEEVFSQRIIPSGDDYFTPVYFNLPADVPGLQHYSVQLTTRQEERNKQNNSSSFVINILENKQKILIISEGPHPDLGAIKNSLEQQQNYEVSLFSREPYPDNFNDFNLVLLNQIPSTGTAGRLLFEKALENSIPLLLIVGNKTYLPQLNLLGLGIEIIPQAGLSEEAQPVLNPAFELFTMDEEFIRMVEKFPPLHVPFAEYNLDAPFSEMLFQNINNIKTRRPLIAMGKTGNRKLGVIYGEGIWRWRLYNYYFNESHEQFDHFVNSIVQYLALRENEDNFIVEFQPVFYDTDPVVLKAEVYNESFEAINEPEVSVNFTGGDGESYSFVFDRSGLFYHLDAGKLPVGDYSFEASVAVGEEIFKESGKFTIVPLNIENTATRADFNLLYQMAASTGGDLFPANQVQEALTLIKNSRDIKPVAYSQAILNELLNMKWLFFVLLIIVSVEWFLRKYWGIY